MYDGASAPDLDKSVAGSSNGTVAGYGKSVYEKYDDGLGAVIRFRPVQFADDFELLYGWHQYAHVARYWNLSIPREAYREHLKAFLADKHQALYIGELDGVPMSYWECYWAVDDIIATGYEALPDDQGVHLLIGPPEYIGRGLAGPLLAAMTEFLFRHEATMKVVAEPDAGNEKMIHIFQKCGYRFQKHIDLPDKRAALMFCDRERWRS
ncbi:GNAT family N-acetyltransferase [Paenibacillus sp. GCM10027627]|uniref:GNAT family N-acetyltransferase n=1 Tax=unclassified Paenibacillus TaxID=185978 RepID=UPI003624EA8B